MASAQQPMACLLGGGDRRSLGRTEEAVRLVRHDPSRFEELWSCLSDPDPLVRMRAADAAEKLTRDDPALLEPRRAALLSGELDDGTSEVRWHLLPMAGRLDLTIEEARRLMARLEEAFHADPSRIVRACALETACGIARAHPELADQARRLLTEAFESPVPSLRARARRLSSYNIIVSG